MYWFIGILLCFFLLFLSSFSVWNVYAIIRGAPFVPSTNKRVGTMIDLANLQKTDVLLDLGSGDGRILRRVAPFVKEARGIEINPSLAVWSRMINMFVKEKNIQVLCSDFWHQDLSDVDIIFVYCIDNKMNKLETKVKKEMKPGSRVVSNEFKFSNWKPGQEQDGVRLYLV